MQVITPKQNPKTVSKSSKPTKKGTLAPLKPSVPTAPVVSVSFPKTEIDSSERQKLKLLAGNPMKLDELCASLKLKEQQFEEQARKKEENLQRIQDSISALINRKTEDGEPLIDFQSSSSLGRSETVEVNSSVDEESSSSDDLTELSQSADFLQSIDSAVSARESARARLHSETEALLNRCDEDGNKLIEMPANHKEILDMLYSIQSVERGNVAENCIEMFEKVATIINQNEKNKEGWKKIRELDRQIEAKEQQLRALASGNPSLLSSASSTDRPTFVTHYHKPPSKAAHPEKIQRNIELAGNPKAKYSYVERLQKNEKDRLLALESEAEVKATAFDAGTEELALIDEKLKAFVPKEKWEERSIQSYPTNLRQPSDTSFATTRSMLTAPTIMQDVGPGDEELRAQREAREARQRIDAINKSLDGLRERPVVPLSSFEIQKLLCDADETLRDSQAFIVATLQNERSFALENAKSLLAKLETNLKDDDETEETVLQVEIAMKKYEALYEAEQEELEEELKEDPRLKEEEERVRTLMDAYEAKEREIETIMQSLDALEARTKQQLEELNFEEPTVPPVRLEEQSIEEFEQAIERKARDRMQIPEPKAVLTAEEFPLTLHLLGRKPRQEEG